MCLFINLLFVYSVIPFNNVLAVECYTYTILEACYRSVARREYQLLLHRWPDLAMKWSLYCNSTCRTTLPIQGPTNMLLCILNLSDPRIKTHPKFLNRFTIMRLCGIIFALVLDGIFPKYTNSSLETARLHCKRKPWLPLVATYTNNVLVVQHTDDP